MTLEIFTPCFYPNKQSIERLERSCQRFGYNLIPYGVGENWNGLVHGEIIRFRQAIEHSTADVVCKVDGADAWFLRGPEALLEAFEHYQCDVLIGGERQCWPLGDMAGKFDQSGQYPFPNGGNFMGRREAMKVALDDLMKLSLNEHQGNDQAHWLTYLPKPGISVDTECRAFFQTSNDGFNGVFPIFRKGDSEFMNVMTFTCPCLVHFNGGGKDERIAEWDRVVGL